MVHNIVDLAFCDRPGSLQARAPRQSAIRIFRQTRKVNVDEMLERYGRRDAADDVQASYEAADVLARLREQAGLSVADLAERMGWEVPRVYEVERGGGRRGPTYGLIKRLARACGADVRLLSTANAQSENDVALQDVLTEPGLAIRRLWIGRDAGLTLSGDADCAIVVNIVAGHGTWVRQDRPPASDSGGIVLPDSRDLWSDEEGVRSERAVQAGSSFRVEPSARYLLSADSDGAPVVALLLEMGAKVSPERTRVLRRHQEHVRQAEA